MTVSMRQRRYGTGAIQRSKNGARFVARLPGKSKGSHLGTFDTRKEAEAALAAAIASAQDTSSSEGESQ